MRWRRSSVRRPAAVSMCENVTAAHMTVSVDAAAAGGSRHHRVFGRRFPLADLSVPRAGGARIPSARRAGARRRQRGPGAHRRGHGRSHRARRRLARAVPLVVHPRPARRSSSGPARRRCRWCSISTRPPASSPLTSAALGVDFAAGGCLKWLCGGPGNAFLYTRPDLSGVGPAALDRLGSHPQPFAFDIDDVRAACRCGGGCRRHARDPCVLRGAARAAAARSRWRDTVRAAVLELTRRLLALRRSSMASARWPRAIRRGWPARWPSTCPMHSPSPAPSTPTTSSWTTAPRSGSGWRPRLQHPGGGRSRDGHDGRHRAIEPLRSGLRSRQSSPDAGAPHSQEQR